jgi:hypothetical protein
MTCIWCCSDLINQNGLRNYSVGGAILLNMAPRIEMEVEERKLWQKQICAHFKETLLLVETRMDYLGRNKKD